MIDLNALNSFQREAVEHTEHPTLVLAGAGSGKTRVLTYKIAYLVSNGIKPWRIFAATFTNKAAHEMASRVEQLLHIPVENLWIGTFHSLCVRILRREAENWGLRRDFTIYNEDDSISVLKKSLKELGISKERLSPYRVKHIVGKAKNNFISPDKLDEFAYGHDVKLITKVYNRYMERLNDAGAFDFDDLLVKPVEMFQKYPESLTRWKDRFDHILVDEYQDTNHTQYLLMKLLAGKSGNITVVGDDDQSIYSWRGADIKNILSFESDFKKVKTFRLEKNYRSTGNILKAANSVVENNKSRMSKRLWTDRPDGEKVKVLECMSDKDEAERVIAAIERESSKYGLKLKDCVILYRTNAQSRSFEDVLRRKSIPYAIVGGVRFYERMEIRDILAYLRILVNPDDIVSFIRAITTPKRGIGPKTIEAIEKFAVEKKISLVDALNRSDEIFSGKILNNIKDFNKILQSALKMRSESDLYKIAQEIVEKTGYTKYLENEYPESFEERLENVNELITAISEFENITDEDNLSAFLSEVSLVADIDMWDDEYDALTLMTLHSAKGLEFNSVFITGVERGLFPLPQTFDNISELEEERRLFYVGITRAEERIHLSYALQRARFGSFSGGASMFISELPWEILDIETPEPLYARIPVRNQSIRRAMKFEDYSQDITTHNESSQYRVGSYIRHPVFGRGKITACSGSGDRTKLTILFGNQEKKILAKYGRLTHA